MNTEKHLAALLYRHQCVIVPSFGAFITELQSAQINKNATAFHPPTKVIYFNATIKNNDGLLANHISVSEKIPYESALHSIKISVHKWNLQLENENTLHLDAIGSFEKKDDVLLFTPDNASNFLTNSFGLSPFVASTVKREEPREEVLALEEKTPFIIDAESKKPNKQYLKYAALLAIGFSASWWGYQMYTNNEIAKETLLVKQKVQNRIANDIQNATFVLDLPTIDFTKNTSVEIKNYHIVAGVFRNKNNATKIYDELLKKGFQAEIITKENNMTAVYFQSFADVLEATNFKQKMQEEGYKEAWLLEEKN